MPHVTLPTVGVDRSTGLRVALVHDYLTQRGGAERVVLSMLKAFPDAPLYTSIYEPKATFPEFRAADVRTLALDRVPAFRRDHRRALPFLSNTFANLSIDADVTLCSSSGWAHGADARGAKVVYCHNPARWLYQTGRYLNDGPSIRRAGLAMLRSRLLERDRAAAASASLYIANSTIVKQRVRAAYGRDAEVLFPPPTLSAADRQRLPDGVEPGYMLCVSRLLPYKNVGAVCGAFATLPEHRLVVVGTGPSKEALEARAPANVRFLGRVADDELRWLYAHCHALVGASHEDFGLTPLEAASFGKPAATLRWGGYLDTVDEDVSGLFFDRPVPSDIAMAIRAVAARDWDPRRISDHARRYAERRFVDRLREIVVEHATSRAAERLVVTVRRRKPLRGTAHEKVQRQDRRRGPRGPISARPGALPWA